MSEQETQIALQEAIHAKATGCERHILGVVASEDGMQGFGAALVDPDCIIFTLVFGPMFFDLCLN